MADRIAGHLRRAGLWTPTIAAELAEGWALSLNELQRELRKDLAYAPKH